MTSRLRRQAILAGPCVSRLVEIPSGHRPRLRARFRRATTCHRLQPTWHTVEFDDLRFDYPMFEAAKTPRDPRRLRGGAIYIGPGGEVENTFMGGREQK